MNYVAEQCLHSHNCCWWWTTKTTNFHNIYCVIEIWVYIIKIKSLNVTLILNLLHWCFVYSRFTELCTKVHSTQKIGTEQHGMTRFIKKQFYILLSGTYFVASVTILFSIFEVCFYISGVFPILFVPEELSAFSEAYHVCLCLYLLYCGWIIQFGTTKCVFFKLGHCFNFRIASCSNYWPEISMFPSFYYF